MQYRVKTQVSLSRHIQRHIKMAITLDQHQLKQYKLEALGQCIPLPRHDLPVSRSGSGSVIRIATKI